MDRVTREYLKESAGALLIVALAVAAFAFGGCVTATDHADEYSYQPENVFGAWTLEVGEAAGSTAYSVMTFQPTGCVYDELVRVDAAGNVESRVVYRGAWEPVGRTIDLSEPGEPEVVDQFEVRGGSLVLDGVAYRRGRLAAPTLVGTWRSEEAGGLFTLGPGGRFSEPVDLGYFVPGSGFGTSVTGTWDVAAGRLEVRIGSFTSQAVVAVRPFQVELKPGGLYDLVPDDSVSGSP